MDDPIIIARSLLGRLNESSPADVPAIADDLLLFLYRLKDEYIIVRSSSRFITGTSFAVLHDLIYHLESSPDIAMRNPSTVDFIHTLLEDLTRGNILIRKQ
ncbi:MAG: hypothetical protein ACRDGA_13425 [Bacteroidota bacterium]